MLIFRPYYLQKSKTSSKKERKSSFFCTEAEELGKQPSSKHFN